MRTSNLVRSIGVMLLMLLPLVTANAEERTECCSFIISVDGKRGGTCVQLTRADAVNHCLQKTCDEKFLRKELGSNRTAYEFKAQCIVHHLRTCNGAIPFATCIENRESREIEADRQKAFPKN